MSDQKYVPSEESLLRVLAGELRDPVLELTVDDLSVIERDRRCPRDARVLLDRDNPRHPGLNRELYCSCGFSATS